MSSWPTAPRLGAFTAHVGPAGAAVERRTPRRHAAVLRLIACGALSLAGAGCSISMPMAGFVADPVATGSIDRPDALLFKALDQEDDRRAKAALAVALDPQGNGASVAWANPASGAKGSFVAAAPPFTRDARVCRAFKARVAPDPKAEREVEGSACRNGEGDWHVAEATELKARS